jgi:hypothetical protein
LKKNVEKKKHKNKSDNTHILTQEVLGRRQVFAWKLCRAVIRRGAEPPPVVHDAEVRRAAADLDGVQAVV